MSAKLEIRELPKGLSFRVIGQRLLWRISLEIVFGSIFLYFLFHSTENSKLVKIFAGGLCMLAVIRDAISSLRGTSVELQVNNFDFTSSGHSPNGYKSSTIARADISNLEFQKALGGDNQQPSGLYVEYQVAIWASHTCILPDIDEAQTNLVIEAIYKRFPDTGTLAAQTGATASSLISLNLNQPDRIKK